MCVKPDNYVTIQGWMISELGLKGTDLMVFSIIYSFCQDECSSYRGGIGYLREWCQASKPTIINSIKNLCNLNLIVKLEKEVSSNIKINEYVVNHDGLNNFTGGKKTLPNNKEEYIYSNINNNINNSSNNIITNIINNFNYIIGANFLTGGKNFREIIRARLNEGYLEEDFYKIAKLKKSQWKGTEYEKYLKPSTLFIPKHFDDYRNEAIKKGITGDVEDCTKLVGVESTKQVEEEPEMSDEEWYAMMEEKYGKDDRSVE